MNTFSGSSSRTVSHTLWLKGPPAASEANLTQMLLFPSGGKSTSPSCAIVTLSPGPRATIASKTTLIVKSFVGLACPASSVLSSAFALLTSSQSWLLSRAGLLSSTTAIWILIFARFVTTPVSVSPLSIVTAFSLFGGSSKDRFCKHVSLPKTPSAAASGAVTPVNVSASVSGSPASLTASPSSSALASSSQSLAGSSSDGSSSSIWGLNSKVFAKSSKPAWPSMNLLFRMSSSQKIPRSFPVATAVIISPRVQPASLKVSPAPPNMSSPISSVSASVFVLISSVAASSSSEIV